MMQSGIVTFLFTDLIRSTEHLQRVGDEAGQRLFNSHHQLMTRAVTAIEARSSSGLAAEFSRPRF
jgi:hypothetical protein